MKYCAICHAELSQDAEHSVLLVGRLGTSYEICSGCENVMDGVFSEDDSVRTNAKAELYRTVHKNEHIQHNAELLGYFADILESDGSLPAEETDDITVEDDEETLPVEEGERLFEFRNTFSKEALNRIRSQFFRSILPIMLLPVLIVAIPTFVMIYRTYEDAWSRTFGMVVFGICFVIATILLSYPKRIQKGIPSFVSIVGNTIVAKIDTMYEEKSVLDVSIVIDYGCFYQIQFTKLRSLSPFFCVKDSITIGDIDAFEKLFEGKIVRKRKSDS